MRHILGTIAVLIVAAAGFLLGRQSLADKVKTCEVERARYESIEQKLEALGDAQANARARNVAQAGPLADAARTGAAPAVPPTVPPTVPASATAPTAAPERPTDERRPPSPESIKAERSARTVLDSALRAKRWTETDRQKMREDLVLLDDDARKQLLRDLVRAFNSGSLDMREVAGPPL
jgi:3-oxoacyl-ACP reductase-like protein